MDRESESRLSVDDLALDWFTRLRGDASAGTRAEFERWIAASPSHRAAFRRAESLWSAAEVPGAQVAREEAASLSRYLAKIERARTRRRQAKRAGTVAGLLLALLAGGLWFERPNLLQDFTADFVTERAGRQLIQLPDGSSVLLDADSALVERFTQGERRVALLRGGAFFTVEKTGTPFVVEAASGEVRVVGTRFDVRLEMDGAVVTVAQGRVSVTPPDRATQAMVEPGQQVRFDRRGLGRVGAVDLDDALAWQSGRFSFYQARFADVVDELRRYRSGRVIILNQELAEKRVTGSFSLDDPDAALEALQSTVGFQSHSIGGRLLILR